MKVVGLIGGLSWESSALYYRLINEGIKTRLGGLHSAKLLLWSFDFAEISELQAQEDWSTATNRMIDAGQSLYAAGAECLVICTNTMHKMADEIQNATGLPLINVIDVTAEALKKAHHTRPLLLGTGYTMTHPFYRDRLTYKHAITAMTPNETERTEVHRIIYEELCRGIIRNESRSYYLHLIEQASQSGADCVILGCTEIGILIDQTHTDLPVYDTTQLHANAAVHFACS